MSNRLTSGAHRAVAIGAILTIAVFCLAQSAVAQDWRDMDWSGNTSRLSRIDPGAYVTVRVTQPIEVDRARGRVYAGVVDSDVWDDYRRLSVPAIPRGSRVDLVVRAARDGDLILDLDSIYAHGVRYVVAAAPERIEAPRGRDRGGDAVAAAGSGAVIGTIIGAIAGGGKGAAIGAAAGAVTGLALASHGREIHVPRGSLLTFRLERPLVIVAPSRPDRGDRRDDRRDDRRR
jgi:hypothetical protein